MRKHSGLSSCSLIVMCNYQRALLLTLVIASAVLLPVMLVGQGYFGTVSGVLTDPSGAMVQGARVTLLDEQKGYQFTTTSNNEGRYLFVSIPPGMYTVTAEMKGFEKTAVHHVKLNISENPTANLTLRVAAAAERVVVEAQTTTIATEDAVTGQVVDRRMINDLPLISRDVTELTYLSPGITNPDDQCPNCGSTNWVSNGSRGATADILMDGATVTNFEPNGGVTEATYIPSPEAVEEFKLQQSNFSAEYGFSGASVLNMVTRSGTNSFHGSVYDFIRNTITDANDWFNDHSTPVVPIPPVHRHDFGGTIGGPIIKNKTFFFFDYEGSRSTDMHSYFAGVPSPNERTGNFSELCTSQGGTFNSSGMCTDASGNPMNAGQLWDPYSGLFNSADNGPVRRTFIPGNRVDQYVSPGCTLGAGSCPPLEPTPGVAGNLIDPVAQKVMNLFPAANMTNGTLYKNWTASGTTGTKNNQFDIKIDHRFSEKNLLSAKYSQQWSSSTPFSCFKNLIDPCGGGSDQTTAHLFTLNDAYTISPTMLLNVTLGFTRGAFARFAYNSSLGSDPLGTLGFPSYLQTEGFKGVPAMVISYYRGAGFANAGDDPYGNYKQGKDTGQLTVALSKIHGPHELKFGFEGRIHQMNYVQTNAPLGYFNFDNRGSSICPSPGPTSPCADGTIPGGDSMASFLMGQVQSGSYEIQFRPATTDHQYAGFAQDNWKVTHKLTLNLGLRYDVSLPRTERFNRQNSFDPNVASPLGSISYQDPVTSQRVTVQLRGGEVFASPSQRNTYVTDWKDIQPRFGFAFQFAPKMVVRGGYGMYFGQSRSGVSGVVPYTSQGFSQWTSMITLYPLGSQPNSVPWTHLNNPFPNGLIQPAGNSLGLKNDVGLTASGSLRTGPYNITPNEQSWTFGVERQMPWNVVVSADYVGKKGTHLPFDGTSYVFDRLGPWVESLPVGDPNAANPCQALTVACLNTQVPNPFSGIIPNPNSSLFYPTVAYSQLLVPYPQFTGVNTDVWMVANSTYHALQLTAEKRFSNGLEFLVNYTWSKSIDDSSQADDNVSWLGSYTALQDPNKPWLERSLSTFDIPSVLKFSYTYELPFGRGKALLGNMPRVVDAIIGGWKTNGIWQISAGRPLALTVTGGGNPLPTYGGQRPVMTGRLKRNYGHDWQDQFFADPLTAPTIDSNGNTVPGDILNPPAAYALGTVPRAIADVRSPLVFTSDLSLIKQFLLSNVHEGIRLELRLEAQNAFNHPVFSMGAPGPCCDSTLNVGDPSFGQIPYTAIGARQGQLAVKISF